MTTATSPDKTTRRHVVCLAGIALGVSAFAASPAPAATMPLAVAASQHSTVAASISKSATGLPAVQEKKPDIWQWWQDESRPGLQQWLDNGGSALVGPGGVPANPADFPAPPAGPTNPPAPQPAPQPGPPPGPTKPIPDAPVQEPPQNPGGGFGDFFGMLQGMLSMLLNMVGGFFGFRF